MRTSIRYLTPLNFFGFASDGNLNTVGNVSFTSTQDGPTVYKFFNNVNINTGHIVTTTNRCSGLVLYCFGNCRIDGTLTMTARGANVGGSAFAPNNLNSIYNDNLTISNLTVAGAGGAGAPSRTATVGSTAAVAGSAGVNGACGGGGSGGCHAKATTATAGGGSAGTSFSGGAGGGGACRAGSSGTAASGGANGGGGGAGSAYQTAPYGKGAGGGAGNPGGARSYSGGNNPQNYTHVGGTGTGGLILLVVRGDLIISNTGIISANGSNGGRSDGYNYIPAYLWGSGGGGSGGGSITVLYGNQYTNSGTIQANGGAGGAGNMPGGAGGAGSIRIQKIRR